MRTRLAQIFVAGIACLWLAGTALAQGGGVEITRAWARATPAKAANGAAYLTVVSPTADKLTGLSSPVAEKAELHRMTMEGSVMKMRPVEEIVLPPGEPVTLKPGALHIMLFGLKQPLVAGQSFPLTLQFAKAGTREVNVTVEGVGAMAPQTDHGGGMAMPEHGGGLSMPMPAHH